MRISEVINKLQEIQEEHGDLSVYVLTTFYDFPFESMNLKIYGSAFILNNYGI